MARAWSFLRGTGPCCQDWESYSRKIPVARWWWHTPLRHRHRQISDFKARLVYRESTRTVKDTQSNPVLEENK